MPDRKDENKAFVIVPVAPARHSGYRECIGCAVASKPTKTDVAKRTRAFNHVGRFFGFGTLNSCHAKVSL